MKKRLFLSALMLGALCACARSAPDLPPDLQAKSAGEAAEILKITDKDLALDCTQIQEEMQNLKKEHDIHETTIRTLRGQNQAATYLGLFFLPAYLATDNNSVEKEKLDAIQKRFDQLYYLKKVKKCTASN
ncbi:MAG: hypothetical protein MI743_00445 [Sneathiellales bacterium]|nr:hypothetical protein [Sneathiellales bacterium]